jgi:peptidoglycan hydrolase-like protein with peptidoglycan-binding domain
MTVRIGARGDSALKVQQALIDAGAKDNHGHALNPDGNFKKLTREAVINFQKTHVDPQTGEKLKPDGAVGPATARALGLTGDEFEPGHGPSNGGGGAAPVDPSGAPTIVMPPPGDNPLQKTTNLMNMETARLNFFKEHNLPLPPGELAKAVSVKTIADQVDPIIAQGDLGKDMADFATARQNLTEAISAAQR